MILFIPILLILLQNPITFTPEDQSFTIMQPGQFEEVFETIDTDIGVLDVYTVICNPEDTGEEKNFLYLLNYTVYPLDLNLTDSLAMQTEMIDNSISDIIASYDGQLIYQSALEEQAGKLFRMSYGGGGYIMKANVFFSGDRLYIIQVHCTKDKSLNVQMDEFLDSFTSHH